MDALPRQLLVLAVGAAFALDATSAHADVETVAITVQVTSIVANAVVRVAAIGAGVFVVWLGHNTLVRGIKGEFQFEGYGAKLKGSVPGLLFVLLGCAAIGWALATPATGTVDLSQKVSTIPSSASSQSGNGRTGASDECPPPLRASGKC